jgi:hypothetical protein
LNLRREKERRQLYADLRGEAVWSPDGKIIYADRANAGLTDSEVYRIDGSNGSLENLTPHQGEIIYSLSSVSRDGRTLLVTSNERDGYQNVALVDVATKKLTWVTKLKCEAEAGDFSPPSLRSSGIVGRTFFSTGPLYIALHAHASSPLSRVLLLYRVDHRIQA